MPSITSSFAPGIAAAVALPPETSIRGSSTPWITNAGTSNRPSASVRSPDARIATSCRAVPSG